MARRIPYETKMPETGNIPICVTPCPFGPYKQLTFTVGSVSCQNCWYFLDCDNDAVLCSNY